MRSWTAVYPVLSISLILLYPLPCFGRTSHTDTSSEKPSILLTLESSALSIQRHICHPVLSDSFITLNDCTPLTQSKDRPLQHFLSGLSSILSGSWMNSWLLIGGSATGLAASLAGAGSSNSPEPASFTQPGNTEFSDNFREQGDATSPSFYQTSEYLNRTDLDTIKAKEAYANIAAFNSNTGALQGGAGITIAILDTGVDATHPDLDENILHPCETGLPCSEHYSISDPNGHGTHVAGIAAAEKNTSGIHGVAFNARILPGCAYVRGGCYQEPAGNGELMLWSASNGASVTNMSYAFTQGGRTKVASDIAGPNPDYSHHELKNHLFGSESVHAASDYQQARAALQQGLVTIVAAGNFDHYLEGNTPETEQPSVMSMAPLIYADSSIKHDLDYQWLTVINTNNQGGRALSSHACGDAAEFCISAPGSAVTSTYPGGSYQPLSGTSMATPQVSGAFALVAAAFPNLKLPSDNRQRDVCQQGHPRYNRNQCHSKAVVNRLLTSATDLGVEGTDSVYGRGLLNLDAATSLIGTAQLHTSSGTTFRLGENQLDHSFILGNEIEKQLSGIHFIVVDSYDNAGFIYPATYLLSNGDQNPTVIDASTYLHRSLGKDRSYTAHINENLSFNVNPFDQVHSQKQAHYKLNYSLGPNTSLSIGYGNKNYGSFTNSSGHTSLDHFHISQAFHHPLAHFQTHGHSVQYKHHFPDKSVLTAETYHGKVSENISAQSSPLSTTTMSINLTRPITKGITGSFVLGGMRENKSLLASHGSGIWSTANGSSTMLIGTRIHYQLSPSLQLLMSYYQLSTEPEQFSELLEISDDIIANAFSSGLLIQGNDHWEYGLLITQPTRLQSGEAALDLPVRYNNDELSYQKFNINLEPGGHHMEYELVATWSSEKHPLSFKINLLKITDHGNIPDNDDTIALLNLSFAF